ncbi:MAG: retroviral-like aspartic protease family protein [Alphaproteobacteria bacterium]|nr:retroviral-like aspartic protease family protein [Alphaproteobacteria bacterium]
MPRAVPRLAMAIAATLLFVAALLALAAAPARAEDAPYGSQSLIRLSNNRPAVMLTVNGKGPFLFMIDTATSHTVFTPALAARLHLPRLPGAEFDVVTASGAVRSHFYRVEEMAMAGVTVEGVPAVVIDLPDALGIMGALGADFLSNFTIDLNLPVQTVTLYPQYAQVRAPGLQRLRGTLNAHGFIVVPARVSNILVAAVFDSGAQFTVANSRVAAYARGVGVSMVERTVESKVTDAGRQKRFAFSYDFDRIGLGPTSWQLPRIMISDMRVFDQIGLGNQPAIFIGMDLMNGRRIVIDYANASLWLAR